MPTASQLPCINGISLGSIRRGASPTGYERGRH
ncbi:hypothetical protein CGRA01v4_12591 [Colletotrichum graminicola]|nr:hypothetical protein CGRA01v4_12591 [Colletotrichum graminicola]